MSYIGNEPIVSATRTVTEVTATAGQTVFNANGGYTVGYLDVFLNGSKLTTTDFTATNGSSITLTEAAQVGDIVRLDAWGTFSTSTAVLRAGDTMTGALLLPDGSASAPALSNDGDTNTGIFFPAADTIAFSEGGAESMRINSSGDVNIVNGVTVGAPAYFNNSLSISGNTSSGSLGITSGNSATPVIFYTGQYGVNALERMRIEANGRVLIGTTSNPNAALLRVNGLFEVVSYARVGSDGISYPDAATRWGRGSNLIAFTWSGPNLYGAVDGAVEMVVGTTSDYRLKVNNQPLQNSLDLVLKLKPITYNSVSFDGIVNNDVTEVGLIAHEVQEHRPSLVTSTKDKIGENGKPSYQSLNYAGLVPDLIKAIQEQQAIIKSQADTITAMEARLTALENK
jgi:hypothetical protein